MTSLRTQYNAVLHYPSMPDDTHSGPPYRACRCTRRRVCGHTVGIATDPPAKRIRIESHLFDPTHGCCPQSAIVFFRTAPSSRSLREHKESVTATPAGAGAETLVAALRLHTAQSFRFFHTHKLRHKRDGSRFRTRYRRMAVSLAFAPQPRALEVRG